MNIGNETPQSNALNYVLSKAWDYQDSGDNQIKVRVCPYCANANSKFYMNVSGTKADGLWDCKVCSEAGHLTKLMVAQGDRIEGVVSMQDAAQYSRTPEAIPNIALAHKKLMDDADSLDYLVGTRGFAVSVIEDYKLGLEVQGEEKWLLIPYLHKGNCVFVKYRSLPPAKKAFRSLAGREAPLFNEDVIETGLEEVILVEGETGCLSCLSQGIDKVVGIPGANIKKAVWIKRLNDVAPKKIYILYDNDKVGQKAAKEMAKRIGLSKVYNILLPDFTTAEGTVGKDINEWFRAGHSVEEFETLKAQASRFDVDGVTNLNLALDELQADLEDRGTEPTLITPWESLNKKLGGMEWGDLVGVIAEGKVGKEQGLSAKILTTTGWTTMGRLHVGQSIASIDGAESVVTGIFPKGVKDMYRVIFSDGRSTRCGKEHLWKVAATTNYTRDGLITVDTEKLAGLVDKGTAQWFVPLFNGEFGSGSKLPIDPWLLGALLGDGGLTSSSNKKGVVRFTKLDPLVIAEFTARVIEHGDKVSQHDTVHYSVTGGNIRDRLYDLGLMHKLSVNKFIPNMYLESTRNNRLALLTGLMDTDGCIDGKYKVPVFNTSSEQLAKDVQYLARSLGGIAKITSRIPSYTHNGEKRKGKKAYRVFIKLEEPTTKFSHKAENECVRTRHARLSVISVEPFGREEAQCISVSHPSKLYITDDFIVTHNSTMCLNWLDYYSAIGIPSMFYCLEMPPKRLARKWCSFVTETDDTPGASKICVATIKKAKSIAAGRSGDLLFAYSRGGNKEEVFDTIRQAVSLYGVKVVCFDNLQLLCRSIDHSAQETSILTKSFKDLAMELGILIILVVQPNRVKDGEIVAARNSMGSSAIEKDVDSMIVLHRKRIAQVKDAEFMGFMDTDATFEPNMMVKVDLNRYGPGGITTLLMEGHISRVREFNSDELNLLPKQNLGGIATESVAV